MKKTLKSSSFCVIFPTSIRVLFEIHQKFKGHFLNKLRVSFNEQVLMKEQPITLLTQLRNINFKHKMKRPQIPQKLLYEKFYLHQKKIYVHEIITVNLWEIYFLKNAKKQCQPNNHDLNRNWINTWLLNTDLVRSKAMILFIILSLLCRIQKICLKQPFYTWVLTTF